MSDTITLKLSRREKRELERHGNIRRVIREAIQLYLKTRRSEHLIARLTELQKLQPRTRISDDVRMIRADRAR